ncbi:MAG: hypothetical protein PHU21_06290 [Elusimicrobia bacterium]|nr:hypothetical protein [Elusimicrobiota bacterium]
MVDPRTGQPFAGDAGEEALRSAQEWLRARGEQTADDPSHGSLASRIEVMSRDRERMEKPRTAGLKDKAAAIQATVGKGF